MGTTEATLSSLADEHARSRPEGLAVVCGDQRLTWSAFRVEVQRLASALHGAGVGPGDRVLWLGQNCHRVLLMLAACARLGAVLCPVNWRQSSAELAFVLDDADPKLVFWQEEEVGEAIRSAREAASTSTRWIQHDGPVASDGEESYAAFIGASAPTPSGANAAPEAPVLMIYTGAFGGRPHGALLSNRALTTVGVANAFVRGLQADDVFLNSGPLFHLGTWMCTLATYVLGATNVFVPRVDAELLLHVIAENRCTGAFLMPTTVSDLIALQQFAAGGSQKPALVEVDAGVGRHGLA